MDVDVLFRPGCRVTTSTHLRELTRKILKGIPSKCEQISILLTNDEEIRLLNQRFRGLDRATDVLSFPACEGGLPQDGHLGDVVISVETARRQARSLERPLRQEIDFLLLHGLLHLLGYDHETDQGEMERLQTRLARTLLQTQTARSGSRQAGEEKSGHPAR